uniref:glutamate--tRNA ligase n=1 Tax=Dermatophagoides pteronyssinus TaxID=6956 RepID=A0A6P6XXI7_DERPT
MVETYDDLKKTLAKKLDVPAGSQVVTRFAPEPSGYLHIGHIKAVMLNQFFVRYYGGRLILRFDDTNPSRESEEFEKSIIEDLRAIGVHYDELTYSSDYFDRLHDAMLELIRAGKAFCDDTSAADMKEDRQARRASAHREKSVEQNLADFAEICAGSERGQKLCVRGKIDFAAANGAMRDPVFWRVNLDPHQRTGTKYKSYATYDFACPLIDSWSGVTHALRANEYADRIPLYFWVQQALGVRPTKLFEFSRLNLTNTVLSKRKLNFLVDNQYVEGWHDPRFPTVRGMLRRGLLPAALEQFMVEQGPSKNTNLMEWDKIWSLNSRLLDAQAPRLFAVPQDAAVLEFELMDGDSRVLKSRLLHPKNPCSGSIDTVLTKAVWLDRSDAAALSEGEEVTLMSMGNVVITALPTPGQTPQVWKARLNLDGDFKSTKKKLHWLSATEPATRVVFYEFDHLITKQKPEESDELLDILNKESKFRTAFRAESALQARKLGDFVQFVRIGFVRVDAIDKDGTYHVIFVPSGKTKSMSVVNLKVDPKVLAQGSAFEKNCKLWQQLWKAVNLSSVVLQVVDARNPLLFYSDAFRQTVERQHKVHLLVLNKADFLTPVDSPGMIFPVVGDSRAD